MADQYGAQVSIPNGANPSQLPQPAGTPPPDEGHPFNEDALGDAFDKIGSQPSRGQGPASQPQADPNDVQKLQASMSNPQQMDNRQFSGVNAQGTPSQLAQASIGRNINERLQIWSNLVGDSNAMIGPPIGGQNDIWIRGKDNKFHPADTGHTDFLQDLAKKTGAGIDLTTQAVAAIGGTAAGTFVGVPEIGAAVGYAAGPGISSAGRQFLMTRMYGVKPDPQQLKRDIYIGGAMNLFVGGVMSGMSRVTGNAAESISSGPNARMSKLADAQVAAKNFMDVVGAQPSEIINSEGNIEAPMSEAGERLWSATQYKRRQLNDLISTANEQIVAASPNKVNTQGLAGVVRDFMQKDGYKFDDKGMPIPYQSIPVNSEDLSSPMINLSRIDRPKMGTEAMNDLAEDYKALTSGQMDMDNYLQMIRDWQENAKFKTLDARSDATRSGWSQLQHMATTLRQQEISSRLGSDPEMLNAVNSAYHEYSSSKDAIDMIYNAYSKNQNSPELLAKLFVQPGKKELLSQAKSLFADKPEIMKDVRSAWLSEKLGTHIGSDGVFNANSFIADLKSTGGETLNQLFSPGELGSLYRSAKVMGNIKTSDLISQSQGQGVVDAIGDLTKASTSFSFSKPQGILRWLENKPKFTDYVSSPEGLSRLAAKEPPRTAAILNGMSTILKNKAAQSAVTEVLKTNKHTSPLYNKINPFGVSKPVVPPPQGSQGSDAAADAVFK